MSNDTINVQRGIVGAGSDDDTYVLSASLIDADAQITITDVEGANKIQLIGGLTIASSIVAGDTAQLTLSNGAVVTVLGASSMSYEVGGNPLTGTSGVTKDYSTFANDILGTTVPADGEDNATGGETTVNEDGTATGPTSPTYALTAGAASVDEGATATFALATTNVAEGETVAYTITGVDAADVDGGLLTGTATVAADGSATISVALLADLATEGEETLTVTIDGTTVTASSTVADTSIAPVGQSFTLTTGTDSGADFTGGEGDDTYTAAVLTATAGDSLDGGAGTDTLNVETVSNLADTFVTANIETVNLTALGALSVDTKNMTGLTAFNSNNASGTVTVNNIAAGTLAVGLSGAATNSIDLNYVTGALSGTSDNLSATLNGASSATVTADSGFESVDVNTTAASTLGTLTASGATALTLSGSATLGLSNGTVDSFTDYTVSNTAKVTFGTVASVKSFNASANTDGIVTSTTTSATLLTNGTSDDAFTMHSAGGSVTTGSGNDIINVDTSAVFSTNSTTITLGAGDDNLILSNTGAGKDYIFGGEGNDTIYLGAATTTDDLIDGGAGTDTLNLENAAVTYSVIAKGVENVGIETGDNDLTLNFVTTDSATAISDASTGVVAFTNLLNGTTYTSTAAKTGNDLATLGFKAGEAATVNANFTKGSTGGLTVTNAADITATYGAASVLGGAITLDATATKLTVSATGALTGAQDIAASSTEKLATVAVTGDKAITLGNITNDAALTDVSVSSTGGAVTLGTVGDAGNNSADVAVNNISVASSTHGAAVGNIDFTGVASTTTGSIATISANGVGTTGGEDATIGTIDADTLGTATATSTKQDATIGNVTVGADTATTYTDGTITALKASGFLEASIGNVLADNIGSIVVESTDSTTGGAVSLGNVDAADGTANKATIGTIDVSSKTLGATVGTLEGTTLGNVTVSGGTTATLGAVTVGNSTGDSVTNNITVTSGSGAATLGAIDVEVAGTITAKSTSAGVVVGAMTFDDTSGVTVSLDASTTVGFDNVTIQNTKGDLSLTAKAGSTFAVGTGGAAAVSAGSASTTDTDIVVNASSVTGAIGGTTAMTVTNLAQDTSSSTIVSGGAGANTISIAGHAGTIATGQTITYNGQAGVDTITLTGSYLQSTINAEGGADVIVGGSGNDTVVLTETTAAADSFTYEGDGTNSGGVDTITGFSAGGGGTNDDIIFSTAAVEGISSVTDFTATDASSITTGAVSFQTVTGADTLAGTHEIIVANLTGNIASTSALETALETGGGLALTTAAIAGAGDAFLVAYDDGTNTYIATVASTAGATSGGTFAANDLTATNIITLSGVSDVTSLAEADFGAIIA